MLQLLGLAFRVRSAVSPTVLCCWLLVAHVAIAQQQLTDLKKPVAMTMHQGTGYAFVVEELADQVTRWDGEQATTVASSLSENPAQLKTVVGATFRERNCVTLVGYAEDDAATAKVVTYRTDTEGKLKIDPGLTGDLLLDERNQSISAVTSTDLSIHFATLGKAEPPASDANKDEVSGTKLVSRLWQLNTGKATLGKPRLIHKLDGRLTALAMNVQGHIVAAVESPSGAVSIQFFQVLTGKPLVQISSDMQSITSLGFEPKTHTLYAAGSKDDREGIYRIDSYFDGTSQLVRGTMAVAIDGAKQIVFSEQRTVVMIADGDSGRLANVELD